MKKSFGELKYKRVLLKLSGESLAGGSSEGIDRKVLESIAKEIGRVTKLGVQVGIVITFEFLYFC